MNYLRKIVIFSSIFNSSFMYAQLGQDGTGTISGYDIQPSAYINNAYLIGADLNGANLKGAQFYEGVLINASFRNANLINVQFSDTNLTAAMFADADLTHAKLYTYQLDYSNFTRANLSGANFDAYLYDYNEIPIIEEARFTYSTSDSESSGPRFSGYGFINCDFSFSDLENLSIDTYGVGYYDLMVFNLNLSRANLKNSSFSFEEVYNYFENDSEVNWETYYSDYSVKFKYSDLSNSEIRLWGTADVMAIDFSFSNLGNSEIFFEGYESESHLSFEPIDYGDEYIGFYYPEYISYNQIPYTHNFIGTDFSNATIRGYISGIYYGTRFNNADCTEVNFIGLDQKSEYLEGHWTNYDGVWWNIDFNGTNLSGATFKYCELSLAKFENNIFTSEHSAEPTKFEYCDFTGIHFQGRGENALKVLVQAKYENCSFQDSDFVDYRYVDQIGNIYTASIEERDIDLSDSYFVSCNFEDTNLHAAIFRDSDLSNSSFKDADLRDVDFTNANLTGVNFIGAQIEGAIFTNAILTDAKIDLDNDGIDDSEDEYPNDTDNDGVDNDTDLFPNDPNESTDEDGDGIGDNSDEYPNDTDNDGVDNDTDLFPNDPNESTDFDNDGIGDNSDLDDDSDGIDDINDPFPLDSSEWLDTDSDGIGDNSDLDDDGDMLSDIIESTLGLNPKASETYASLSNAITVYFAEDNSVTNTDNIPTFSLNQIKDLRSGSTMIEVSGNQATVQLQMEESSDLQTWEDTGTPATMIIPADTDTKFFRFKMVE